MMKRMPWLAIAAILLGAPALGTGEAIAQGDSSRFTPGEPMPASGAGLIRGGVCGTADVFGIMNSVLGDLKVMLQEDGKANPPEFSDKEKGAVIYYPRAGVSWK